MDHKQNGSRFESGSLDSSGLVRPMFFIFAAFRFFCFQRGDVANWLYFFRKRNLKQARELLLAMKENCPDLSSPELISEAEELDRTCWKQQASCKDFLLKMQVELDKGNAIGSAVVTTSSLEWMEARFACHVTSVTRSQPSDNLRELKSLL